MYNKNGAHGTCWAPSKAAYGMGLFKLLIGLLVAGKKLVALAVVPIGTLVVKLLKRRSAQKQASAARAE